MIVIYDLANVLSLPYTFEGKQLYFDFVPGKNEISPDVWKAIVRQNKDRLDNHYSRHLHVFQPKLEQIVNEDGSIMEVEVGSDVIDFNRLSTNSALQLIENIMDPDELKGYLEIEKSQRKPRKAILNALNQKIEEIEAFDRQRKEDLEEREKGEEN